MDILSILKEYIHQKFFRQFRTREKLEQYQEKQVQEHLQFVLKHSPFYRDYYQVTDETEINNWRHLPMIEKTVMMEHFTSLNTVGMEREEAFSVALKAEQNRDFSPTINGVTIGLSSGTSGNRGLFIVSPTERKRWAGVILAKLLPANIWHRQKIAFFLRANSNLYTTTQSNRIAFAFFDLLDSFTEHVERLNRLQPTILVAPPSMLRFLAKSLREGELQISPLKILSVAEVLDPMDEQFIQETFEQKVHQVYQCTEGFLGCTCEHGTIHINEELLIMEKEYLDDHKFIPIITDFSRKAQPILRYRLNDILTERTSPCPCGSPMLAIEKIEGRSDDIFYFQRGEKRVPLFPDFIRRTIISASNEIEEYRVIQTTIDQIEIQIKWKQKQEEDKVRSALTKFFLGQDIKTPYLAFQDYDFQPGVRKLRRVESRIQW
ncbi:F390 synthetase-related protein [Lederbergia galactosidilytica]|uniref:Adenylate cyclase n=1 Tax=Lederbergia galactosidilytica TaxID=217031 RepID=A0A177ZII4_9BACI|nr:F390 synthetase-related protein [Lederbergia galactosidilytica]KRG16648.1 adenylate cyclase [Virgibacillus soli]OAK67767.1 adenylate cyclase [Lederbergia galactosidilytica]